MLKQLHIRNYAIIKEVEIAFDEKLNIITGETGAGKSILMGALGLILGERADAKSLLNTEEKCVVEGWFDIQQYKLKPYFEAEELDYEPTCIIRREIAPNGKSRAFINDTPVNLNQLKELGAKLVDIVGQHDTLDLNNTDFQLSIIDAVADNQALFMEYQRKFTSYKQLQKQLLQLQEQEAKARQDEDYFQFILNEIVEINPLPDEQAELELTLDALSNAEQIQQHAANAFNGISGDEQCVIEALRNIKSQIQNSAKHHKGMEELAQRIESNIIELKDIAAELENIADKTQADPVELERVEQRLQALFNLHKKHRVANNSELLAFKQELEEKLQNIGSLSQQIAHTETQLHNLKQQCENDANTLSEKRTKAIPKIEKQVNELLVQVQMPDAQLKINHHQSAELNVSGKDHIEMLFAANKGSALQPIQKVASGGELSRVMLCIKSLVSDKMALPTIVFDEIDTGISGEAALKVSKVMKQHALKHQVIAITHLPQIAGKADNHLFVYKTSDKQQTHTHIKTLTAQERVEEIARMLHGENPSEKVLEAAKELIG